MKKWLHKLHGRIGDFWWYSLMLFCACRAADLLNAFVGLWLVPKYVDPAELGAVTPLGNFAGFLALPVAVFATTFRNEVSRLSICREFGKLKTLMRTVFIATGIFLFVAIVVARFTLPMFLERIRIVEGSLGMIIIATAFLGAVSPVFTNAIQALGKFKANAAMNLVGAPLRLLTMLVAMPFRPLSGFFVGQGASPTFNILASVFYLRKELSVRAEPYWSRDTVRKFTKLLAIFLASGTASAIATLVESTVLRQRLPDLDSAGYYMATRFSEISSFLYNTLVFTLFPFTASLAAKGRDARPLILKAATATVAFSALVALPFFFFGRQILSLLPHGDQYAAYWWAIPWLIGISTLGALVGLYTTAEISANRFGFMKWMVPLDILYPTLLMLVTGYGYFENVIPSDWFAFLKTHNIYALDTMLWWMTGFISLKCFGCALAMSTKQWHVSQIWRSSMPMRFLIVGSFNFIFGYLAFAVLYWLFACKWSNSAIITVSTVIGVTESYLAHRTFTYNANGVWWREYLRFYVVYGVQYFINLLLIWVLVTNMALNAYIVQFVISCTLTIASYWAHKVYSFHRSTP